MWRSEPAQPDPEAEVGQAEAMGNHTRGGQLGGSTRRRLVGVVGFTAAGYSYEGPRSLPHRVVDVHGDRRVDAFVGPGRALRAVEHLRHRDRRAAAAAGGLEVDARIALIGGVGVAASALGLAAVGAGAGVDHGVCAAVAAQGIGVGGEPLTSVRLQFREGQRAGGLHLL